MTSPHQRKQHYPYESWKITETEFRPDDYRLNEALMALANGYMGQRSSFEEDCSGVESLPGTYIAGVFDSYPNQTMIKLKGRPSHPNKMVNVPAFLPVVVFVDDERLDLNRCSIESYKRQLHLDRGVLTREAILRLQNGKRIRLQAERFLSFSHRHLACSRLAVTPLDADAVIRFESVVDGSVKNVNTEHLTDVRFYEEQTTHGVVSRTAYTDIAIAVLAAEKVDGAAEVKLIQQEKVSRGSFRVESNAGAPAVFEKIAAVATSRDVDVHGDVASAAAGFLQEGCQLGFDQLLTEQEKTWHEIWKSVEIDIKDKSGSEELTQGLHYAIFQMVQSAPNRDHTVNIGAKGLTGEHYFGTYFWDTEVFMLPLYAFALPEVAKNLVRSRFHMLPGARGKAAEMDLAGAAFPFMADDRGQECATLWQFGLLGIHVTAAVAWGVWLYYCTTGDLGLVAAEGIDIMVETSRFWRSRVFYREDLGQFVINRVLGPDEYHQGVDNNYYTNIMAQENLLKTVALLNILRNERPEAYQAVLQRLELTSGEIAAFEEVGQSMHLPYKEDLAVNLQDDRFHLLEPHDLQADPLPGATQAVWSYDRIMRKQVLRQGDVVVAHVLVGDRFDRDQIERDFDYYEPKTSHDSSLSFCTHSIVAAALGRKDAAYDYFMRTARLDLDDMHGNSWMGIHTANLGGAWQCVVLGFGGVRWYDGNLSMNPLLPDQWEEFTFSIWWHGIRLTATVRPDAVVLNTDGGELRLELCGQTVNVVQEKQEFSYTNQQ